MYKLMIADDEPKIRNGLKKMLDYSQFGIEVIGEAEDGEIALCEATKKQPDILFLDICMPFLNGMDLLKKIKEKVNCLTIVITGYDEFVYMQEAIKLHVFDYLLKPITKADLTNTIKRACKELEKQRSTDRYFKWINDQVEENIDIMRDNFFKDLIRKGMDKEQIISGLKFFNLNFSGKVGIVVLKAIKRSLFGQTPEDMSRKMLLFGIKNMVSELLGAECFICFYDDEENIVIIGNTHGNGKWPEFCESVNSYISQYINGRVVCEYDVTKSFLDFTDVYQNILRRLKTKSSYKPITLSIIQYIEGNYYDSSFSLDKAADKFKITPQYLSRLLKVETGLTFVDMLTNIRIQKAISLMNTSPMKIYEISELVGYSNQYYFSRSFKKVTGLSPIQYKEGKILEQT